MSDPLTRRICPVTGTKVPEYAEVAGPAGDVQGDGLSFRSGRTVEGDPVVAITISSTMFGSSAFVLITDRGDVDRAIAALVAARDDAFPKGGG